MLYSIIYVLIILVTLLDVKHVNNTHIRFFSLW